MSRHVIIGDIHGCYRELLELLARAGATDDDIIVSVGDLVDRGPDSPAVLRFFQERCARGRAIVLMGNHERKHVRQVFSYSQEITRLQFGSQYAAATEWMSHLPYYYETHDILVVHAALLPGIPIAEQKDEILSGTTAGERELQSALSGRLWSELYEGPKPVAFGHHVVGSQPLVARGLVYGLDTGACHGGRLTALVVPGFQLYSVAAGADYWEQEKRRWQEPVLLAKPWLDLGFAKAAREVDRYRDEGGATIAQIEAWLDSLETLLAACFERLRADAAQLLAESGEDGFTARIESYPHKALLHLWRRGRLDLAAVRQRCATPRKALELASQLGIEPALAPPGSAQFSAAATG